MGSAVFVAYKIVHLVLRARRLAQIKQEIAECLKRYEAGLQQLKLHHKTLLLADKGRLLKVMNDEIMNCVKNHHLTFQQIELFLRQNNCYTYLIARKRNSNHSDNLRFLFPNDLEEKAYHLFTSTRNQDEALEELLEESSTYQENLDKLNDTGFMTMQDHVSIADHFHGGTVLLPFGQPIDLEEEA